MERPFVCINMAMTADGKITSAAREAARFTSPHDRKNMDRLRAEADAVLIGAGTLRAENPPLGVRDEGMRAYRRSLGKPEGLLNVVVTASARLDPGAAFFREGASAGRIVATVEEIEDEKLRPLLGKAEVWKLGRGRVDLAELLRRLRSRGVGLLLVEGGGELNWGLVKDGLVDELYVTVAPSLLGGRSAPTLLEGEGFPLAGRRRLELLELGRQGDEVYCRYAVLR